MPKLTRPMIETLTEEIERVELAIEERAGSLNGTQLLMTIPGVSYYSALMIHAELGEIERFDRDKEVVSYAGLNPVIRESATRGSKAESQSVVLGSYAGFLSSVREQLSIPAKTSI